MSQIHLIAVLCDNHGVIPDVCSLGRSEVLQIRILTDNIRSITGIYHCNGFVAGNHVVDHIVTCIDGLHGISLPDQPFICILDLLIIGGIHGISQCLQCYHKGIPLRIIHVNISFVFCVSKKLPAILKILFVHHCFVIKNSHSSPEIRTGITVAPVIALVLDFLHQILLIWNLFPVKGLQIFFFDQTLDHIIRGNQHVICFTAGKLGVHHFIGLKGFIDHRTACLLFKFLQQIQVDIFACVVYLQDVASVGHAAAAHKADCKSQHQYQSNDTLCFFADLHFCFFHNSRKNIGKNQHQNNDQNHDGGKGIDGGIDSFCHVVDYDGNIFHTVSGHEIGNNKIVKGHGKCQQRSCKNSFLYHRHDYLGQCLIGGCPQVHGRICQVWIQAAHLGIHTGDHIRRTECNMCQQHGNISFSHTQRGKQKHQTDGCYDLRI